jgi:hypothetical protein
MTQVFDLDGDCEDGVDIEVFIPGPPGPPITDVGTISIVAPAPGPTPITATIAAPIYRRQRNFLKSAAGNVNQPAITNPSDNGPWELFIFWADMVNTLTLNNAANILLSGEWVGVYGSILYLQWDGNSQYVEGGRNELI